MYTARMIFADFRKAHPELWRRGITYCMSGYMTIELMIPGVGRVIYRSDNNTLEWIEHWIDNRVIKKEENDARPGMYEEFCQIVSNYIRDNKLTQQEFADLVDISRRSLIKYLRGYAMPKVSTMRRICACINYEL